MAGILATFWVSVGARCQCLVVHRKPQVPLALFVSTGGSGCGAGRVGGSRDPTGRNEPRKTIFRTAIASDGCRLAAVGTVKR